MVDLLGEIDSALPLLWGFFRRTTTAVAEFAKEHPEAGKQLAGKLSDKMDQAHKLLVKRRARRISDIVSATA